MPVTDHAPLLERAFELSVIEQSVPVAVGGDLPLYLRGTCLFNGPARFGHHWLRYRHWLDGDGMVAALAFGDHRAWFTNRFVQSAKHVREKREGRPIFRTFGTAFEGDELKRGIGLESPANVSVYDFAGTLLAFGEQGLPWELDPETLETRGLYTFNGQLNEVTPFSAHAKIDHQTGELFNFGVSFSSQQPTLNVFRFTPDARLVFRRRIPMPYPASVHDFALSEQFCVFFISPYVLHMDALMAQGATLMDALSWQPELGSWLIIASRETGDEVARLPVGSGYCLHLINAFHRAGHLVVDVVEFEKPLYPEYQVLPELFTDTFRGHPVRLTIDVASRTIVDRQDLAYDCSPDFPAHDQALVGHPYEHFWMLGISKAGRPGRKFFDHLVRVDWPTGQAEVYEAAAHHYLGGEPVFIPDPAAPAERGSVVCQEFDADRIESSFVVFDAFTLSAGPVARITLPSPIPLLFHSTYRPARP